MSWGDLPQIVRVLAALAFIVALMGGFAFILKKLGLSDNPSGPSPKKRRLKIIESLPLDSRRRLVLLARDDKQHLVILGTSSETVIETDIEPVTADEDDA